MRARAHHALDAEAAAPTPGTAGIRNEGVALHDDRKLELGLLVRTVVGITVIDANGAGNAVLGHLCPPASAERAEAANEEFGRAVVDAVKR